MTAQTRGCPRCGEMWRGGVHIHKGRARTTMPGSPAPNLPSLRLSWPVRRVRVSYWRKGWVALCPHPYHQEAVERRAVDEFRRQNRRR